MRIINKKLKEKILKMVMIDQKFRDRAVNDSQNKKYVKAVFYCDRKHLIELKKIIKQYSWPTFDMVGKRASDGFWLLTQHADEDLSFQKQCLKLLKEVAKKGQVKLSNVAYLTDRVLLAEGKKIKFGTQYFIKDGKLTMRPVTDHKNLEKIRRQYGLCTMAKQTERIKRDYTKLLRVKTKR